MVEINKIKAFSYAEALISMMIIIITVVCLAPILTKQMAGPGMNPVYVKGAFGCYEEGNTIKSFLCKERNCETLDVSDGCTLELSKKPAHF